MKKCFICQSKIQKVFDLGDIYHSDFIDSEKTPEKTRLCLCQCPNCHLVQLDEAIQPDSVYRQYWYRSSLNPSMVKSLQDVVKNIEKRVNLTDGDIVIDIGCNDGTLFNLYENKNLIKIGYEPALNLKVFAEPTCNTLISDYYQAYYTNNIAAKAKVITAIAMFYDLEDPHKFLEDIKQNLDQDGIFVIQMTDLQSMLKSNAFDNICHEHLEVYSLSVLANLLKEHNLQIFDIEYNNVNGGSVRTYICLHNERKIEESVFTALQAEEDFLSLPENSFVEFEAKINRYKNIVLEFIKSQQNQGKKIFAMGASTKGNTLLQYFGINHEIIPYVSEVNTEKFGLKTVGTNLEIISEKEALEKNPDIFLILPWHFKEGLIKKNQTFLEAGGGLLFPLPEPEFITKSGSQKL